MKKRSWIRGPDLSSDNLKSKIQNPKWVGLLTIVLTLAICGAVAQAQQHVKVAKIGWLGNRPASGRGSGTEIIRRELHALGYLDGQSVTFEYRYAEGKRDRYPELAAELVRLKVDLIMLGGGTQLQAAKNATKTIPIVFITEGDPVVARLVDSLARPGGNITGFTTISPVIVGKRLELLKETVPKLFRVAVLWTPRESEQHWKENQLAARELGLQIYSMEVSSTDKLDSAFKEAIKAGSAAVAVTPTALANSSRKLIADLALKNRLPTIGARADFAEDGGLMSYGADRVEPYKRMAMMVDKILKGANPADIPVEQPTKFELLINLRTAKALGLAIPPVVLMRAERVVK